MSEILNRIPTAKWQNKIANPKFPTETAHMQQKQYIRLVSAIKRINDYQGHREFPGIADPQNSRREFPGISEILAGITGNL